MKQSKKTFFTNKFSVSKHISWLGLPMFLMASNYDACNNGCTPGVNPSNNEGATHNNLPNTERNNNNQLGQDNQENIAPENNQEPRNATPGQSKRKSNNNQGSSLRIKQKKYNELPTIEKLGFAGTCGGCNEAFTEEDTALVQLSCNCKYAYHAHCVKSATEAWNDWEDSQKNILQCIKCGAECEIVQLDRDPEEDEDEAEDEDMEVEAGDDQGQPNQNAPINTSNTRTKLKAIRKRGPLNPRVEENQEGLDQNNAAEEARLEEEKKQKEEEEQREKQAKKEEELVNKFNDDDYARIDTEITTCISAYEVNYSLNSSYDQKAKGNVPALDDKRKNLMEGLLCSSLSHPRKNVILQYIVTFPENQQVAFNTEIRTLFTENQENWDNVLNAMFKKGLSKGLRPMDVNQLTKKYTVLFYDWTSTS